MKAPAHIGRRDRVIAVSLAAASSFCSPAHCQVATVSTFPSGAATHGPASFALYDVDLQRVPRPGVGIMPNATSQVIAQAPNFAASGAQCEIGAPPSPRALSPRAFAGRNAFWPLIARAECRFGLPKGLMDSIVLAESGYDPSVVSRAGAAGLTQLMPATALQLGVLDRFDPDANVMAGARYLRQLLDSFGGDVRLALAAYNAGPTAVRHVRGVPLNRETPRYVGRVLGYWTAPGIGPMSPALPARQVAQMLGFAPSITN